MSESTMRIGFVSLHTSPDDMPGSGDAGGMNVVERAQATALARRGHQVEMITRRTDRRTPAVLELEDGVLLRHLDVGPPVRVAKSAQEAFIPQFAAALAQLGRWDVVCSQHWMSGAAAIDMCQRLAIPHVQSFHSLAAPVGADLSAGEPPESPGRLAAEARLAQESDLVLTISKAEARTVIERCGASPDRVTVVPPGVDSRLFRPRRAGEALWTPGGADERGYVVFAARLQPLKAPDLALRAVAAVPEAIRPHLVIVGDTSVDFAGYRRELDALVAELGLHGQVSFIGPQSRAELARTLRGARLLLLPSYSETFGLVALEAAASGTPTLATPAGGLPEAIADGRSGRLLPTRDPQVWGAEIAALMRDSAALASLGRMARAHAERFDWQWVGRRLEEIFGGLVSERQTAGVR
ncbi:glycosyltransferase [Epidermidibacterium keratini]|nr:glycosyltransferase [Epidermidibacterium keratini]